MRLLTASLITISVLLGGAPAGAQTGGRERTTFSGIKLVDMNARTPEQTVTLVLDRHTVRLVEPGSNTELRTFAYADLTVTHTLSSAPPASAGNPSAAATQPMAMPMYMGKTPRNWLTLAAGSDVATLRVSAKVYDEVKAALQAREVVVGEGR